MGKLSNGLDEYSESIRYMASGEQIFSLTRFQVELSQWADYNFGKQHEWEPLLGTVEEIGELAHAELKKKQGIRGTKESLEDEAKDAVGDAIVYLTAYCSLKGFSLNQIMIDTWGEVRKRDWKKNPANGQSSTMSGSETG